MYGLASDITEKLMQDLRRALDPQIDITEAAIIFPDGATVDLAPLLAYLARQTAGAAIPSLFSSGMIPLHDLYVDIGVCDIDENYEVQLRTLADGGDWLDSHHERFLERTKRRVAIPSLLNDPRPRARVIFGDPGSGKSTLLRFLCSAICGRRYDGFSVAFFVPLRTYARTGGATRDLLAYVVESELGVRDSGQQQLWCSILSYMARDRRGVVFLLDGLDEVTDTDHRTQVGKSVGQLVYGFSVLVSSRRAGFNREIGPLVPFELIDLSDSSIKTLVHNWFTYVHPREEAFQHAFLNKLQGPNRSMARNPCLLSLLCYLNQEAEVEHLRVSGSRIELYQGAYEVLRRDYKEKYQSDVPANARLVLQAFALSRFDRGVGVAPRHFFTRNEYETFAYKRKGEAQEFVLSEIWLRMKILNEWATDSVVHFVHLTFEEWLVAEHLLLLTHEEVQPLIEQQKFNPYWKEVWRFYAGGCARVEDRSDGARRFSLLIQALLGEPDLFEQYLFWLAPLLGEFGSRDTLSLLGFDLRLALFDAAHRMPVEQDTFCRLAVELDPSFFLRACLREVNEHLAKISEPPLPGVVSSVPVLPFRSRSTDPMEALVRAIRLLGYNPLREAGEALVDLTRRRGRGPVLDGCRAVADGALMHHSTETVRTELVAHFEREKSLPRKRRLLEALIPLGDTDVANCILRAAERSPAPSFRVACAAALAQMGDVRAVEIAERLWTEGVLSARADLRDALLESLQDLHDLSLERMLRQWLAATPRSAAKTRILATLLSVKVSNDYEEFLPLTRHRNDELRQTAWTLVIRRGRVNVAPLVLATLKDPAAKKGDLLELVELVGEQRLQLCRPWLESLLRTPGPEPRDLKLAAWIAYTALAVHRDTEDLELLRARIFPAFTTALATVDEVSLDAWLTTLLGGSDSAWKMMRPLLYEHAPTFPVELKKTVLRVLARRQAPELAEWIGNELGDPALAEYAAAALARNDPAEAIRVCPANAFAEKELRRRSVEDDLLFYRDGYRDHLGAWFAYGPRLAIGGIMFDTEAIDET